MMIRGILLGSVAFGAVFMLEKQLGTALVDMRRYDKLRAMSGDPPVLVQSLKMLGAYLLRSVKEADGAKDGFDFLSAFDGKPRLAQSAAGRSIFAVVLSDALRYVSMRAM